jgi:hypothetical protein
MALPPRDERGRFAPRDADPYTGYDAFYDEPGSDPAHDAGAFLDEPVDGYGYGPAPDYEARMNMLLNDVADDAAWRREHEQAQRADRERADGLRDVTEKYPALLDPESDFHRAVVERAKELAGEYRTVATDPDVVGLAATEVAQQSETHPEDRWFAAVKTAGQGGAFGDGQQVKEDAEVTRPQREQAIVQNLTGQRRADEAERRQVVELVARARDAGRELRESEIVEATGLAPSRVSDIVATSPEFMGTFTDDAGVVHRGRDAAALGRTFSGSGGAFGAEDEGPTAKRTAELTAELKANREASEKAWAEAAGEESEPESPANEE